MSHVTLIIDVFTPAPKAESLQDIDRLGMRTAMDGLRSIRREQLNDQLPMAR